MSALLLGLLLAAPPAAIPARPELLRFAPIHFVVPRASDHREVLPGSGAVVFLDEDRALPLVNVSVTIRTGSWLEPAGKEGLAALVGSQMRRGGIASLKPEELDERLEMLAARAFAGIGATSGSGNLNALSDNFEESLRLFVEMLRAPRFDQERLDLAKRQMLQQLGERNDDAGDIEGREWSRLVYGAGHYTSRLPTAASIASITREDLVAFHRRYFYPANMVFAVSGAFSRPEMLSKLDVALQRAPWPPALGALPEVPAEIAPLPPAVYVIDKPDVNQARVSIGLPSVRRDDPDVYALEVMNEILGGGGFTSRITRTVRSNEGLAYGAGSALSFGVYHPGTFRAGLQTKSATATRAIGLVLQELARMRDTSVTPDELDSVKRSLVETFPSAFASAGQRVALWSADEYTHRPPSYWTTYRDRIESVTAADVQRVARAHLQTEGLRILVVGNVKDIEAAGPGAALASLPFPVVRLALPDPLTLQRPAP